MITTKTELTDDQIAQIHDVASELMSNVDEQLDEQIWRLPTNEKYRILITKAVEDYVFQNNYSQEQERELVYQVGL